MPPNVSIIIVNYNGKDFLRRCLQSILKNNYRHYEVVIVDNHSVDGSQEYIKKQYLQKLKNFKLICLEKNFGPAKARNEGVKVSSGKYLAFLDNDTQVDKDWILKALTCFKADKKLAAVQCKLLSLADKKKIDYVGERLGSLGFLISIADYGEIDRGQHDSQKEILAAKSAGMFIKKDIFNKVGRFDEDYFIFMEETDLGWRCWLHGYRVIFCPQSIVYHHFSATKDIVSKEFNNYLVRFHGTKNYILTLCKNLSPKYLVKILPTHLFLWFGLAGYLLLSKKTRSSANILKGIFWDLIHLREIVSKRKRVQTERKVNDDKLFINYQLMEKRSPFYFIKRFTGAQKEVLTPENQ